MFHYTNYCFAFFLKFTFNSCYELGFHVRTCSFDTLKAEHRALLCASPCKWTHCFRRPHISLTAHPVKYAYSYNLCSAKHLKKKDTTPLRQRLCEDCQKFYHLFPPLNPGSEILMKLERITNFTFVSKLQFLQLYIPLIGYLLKVVIHKLCIHHIK